MTQTHMNAAFIRWIAKVGGATEIKPVVMRASNGKYACMVSAAARGGQYNILHLGFTPHKSVANRIALANVIGLASR